MMTSYSYIWAQLRRWKHRIPNFQLQSPFLNLKSQRSFSKFLFQRIAYQTVESCDCIWARLLLALAPLFYWRHPYIVNEKNIFFMSNSQTTNWTVVLLSGQILEVASKLESAGISCVATESLASCKIERFVMVQALGEYQGYYHLGTNRETNLFLDTPVSEHSAAQILVCKIKLFFQIRQQKMNQTLFLRMIQAFC